jgi:integrase
VVKLRKPKYVYRWVRRNKLRPDKEYWYSQPPGMSAQIIPYPLLSEEFIAFAERRNREAMHMKPLPAAPGTFRHLADIYRGHPIFGVVPSKKQRASDPVRYGKGIEPPIEPSKSWRELRPRSRSGYTRYVDQIVKMWGDDLVADLEIEMVVEARDARVKTPRIANHFLAVLTAMLWVAVERKRTFGIDDNVAAKADRFGVKSGVKARKEYWTYEAEQTFLADADENDPVIALGERILAYTGQRPGDSRAMLLTDYDSEKVQVIQSKTGAKVWVKCHKDLKPHLDKAVADARAKGIINGTFIRGLRGEPMGERYFATRWDAVAQRTGTSHLHRQDLRRTAVIRLAEAGCTVPQIAAITGHSLKQVENILETYFVRTYEMGAAAITKLEHHQERRKREQNSDV